MHDRVGCGEAEDTVRLGGSLAHGYGLHEGSGSGRGHERAASASHPPSDRTHIGDVCRPIGLGRLADLLPDLCFARRRTSLRVSADLFPVRATIDYWIRRRRGHLDNCRSADPVQPLEGAGPLSFDCRRLSKRSGAPATRCSWGQLALLCGLFSSLALSPFGALAGTGYLAVTSEPAGIEVVVDGRSVGSTPVQVELKSGQHMVEALQQHYLPQANRVDLPADEIRKMHFVLTKGSPFVVQKSQEVLVTAGVGRVNVISEPMGATIEVDGRRVEERAPVTLKDVSAGEHEVVLRLGDKAKRQTITVRSGETSRLEVSFE